jgi:hypothetical protein
MMTFKERKCMKINGTTYDDDTPENVAYILEACRMSKQRIRIFYGDTITGLAWMEEHEIMGYVGRSTGENKIPLIINNKHSMGGGSIVSRAIICIKTT